MRAVDKDGALFTDRDGAAALFSNFLELSAL